MRVAACGICGTDVSFIGSGGFTGEPMPLGHEMAGVVEWVGAEVAASGSGAGDGVAIGDRVIVCPLDIGDGSLGTGAGEGGLTPLLLVRDVVGARRLFPVPDGMALTTAALAEPLAVGMQAVNQAEVRPGEKVAVFGCGPIGLMALATLADRGIDDVVAVDLSPARLDLARRVGAAHVLDPTAVDVWAELKRLHGTVPFRFGPTAATDVFIDAAGADRLIGDVLRHGRVDGRLVVVALHHEPVATNYLDLLMKQFTIRGSIEYPERFEDAIELLARRDLSGLITHTVPLEAFGDGLAVLTGSKDCGKVMVVMGTDDR